MPTMSASGTKRTSPSALHMSLLPKADMAERRPTTKFLCRIADMLDIMLDTPPIRAQELRYQQNDHRINHHLSQVWVSGERANANRRPRLCDCGGCGERLKPDGDCRVLLFYGTMPCPPTPLQSVSFCATRSRWVYAYSGDVPRHWRYETLNPPDQLTPA